MVDYTSQDMMNEWKKFYEMLKKTTVTTEKAEDMLKAFQKVMTETVKQADKFNRNEEARENQLQRWAKAQYLLHAKDQSLQKQKNKDTQDQIRLQSRAKSLHNQEMSTRQDDYFRGVRMNKRLSQSNKSFEKSLDLVTGNLFSWFPLLGKGVNQFGRTVKGMSDYNKNMKDYQDQFSRTMSESIKKKGTPDEGRANEAAREAFEELRNYMASPQGVLGKIEIRGKKVSDLLEGAKTYFNKHKTGILFGVGAFVGLVAVLKKALEVSPMFQQMVKLLNFGVMMVLRPIGDFFGFIMRPILIALMRYFILPWFRVAYPFYRKWGDRIGRLLSGDTSVIGEIAANAKLEDLAAILGTFGVSGTVLWGLSKLASKLLGIVKPAAAVVNPPVVPPSTGGGSYTGYTGTQQGTNTWKPQGNQGIASGNPVNKSPVGNVIKPTPPPPAQSTGAPVNNQTNKNARRMGDLINKLKLRGINSLKGVSQIAKFLKSNQSTFLRIASMGGKAAKVGGLAAALFEPIRVGIAAISSTWKNHDPEGWMAMQMATGGIDPDSPVGMIKAFTGFSGFGSGVSAEEAGGQTLAHTNKWNKNKKTPTGFTGYTGNQVNAADVAMANGGIISEPIIGVGKSGRTYSFGEKGSETVIPHGASAGGITINIQNMSGSHNDLQNLRKVIMQVMQESNTARGRI